MDLKMRRATNATYKETDAPQQYKMLSATLKGPKLQISNIRGMTQQKKRFCGSF